MTENRNGTVVTFYSYKGGTGRTMALANVAWILAANGKGFYLLKDGELVVGPFQGKPACVRIALGKGVCGTAAAKRAVVIVENVHEFDGHIACDSASNSEIVLPLVRGNELIGVLDLDSPQFSRFDAQDQVGLEKVVATLLRTMSG